MELFENKRQLLINILIGVIFISIPFLSSPDLKSGGDMLKLAPFQHTLISYLLLLLFLYFNYYYLVPKFYIKKQWLILIGFLIGCYLIVYFLPTLIIPTKDLFRQGKPPMPFPIEPHKKMPFMFFSKDNYLFHFLLVFALSLHLRINDFLKQIKTEQLTSEISYLKAQITPHFLFNTLNNIYALTLKKSDQAPDAILKLSNIMRYVVTESDQETVNVLDEIEYIKDYIELQKIKLTKNTNLIFKVDTIPNHLKIAPILLIIFIENAFKYGISQNEKSKINILISFKEPNILTLFVENNVYYTNNVFDKNSTKEGLKNTKKRLEYLYPKTHKLNIVETLEKYTVKLELKLDD